MLLQPLMLIVPDIEDVYTLLQIDVIVHLSECRDEGIVALSAREAETIGDQGLQVQEYFGNLCKRIPTDVDLPAVHTNL
ncbi:hypothetical protein L2E82_06022 [Cichorium intybus]|uniref:Uncharacterized protein n=1 Tax=Cichorium intybus TaxID=13427 RepID=A0ACB9H9D1_CICIN|nr:hypothetical protein L2E82_06022 [Cichorium intybus]